MPRATSCLPGKYFYAMEAVEDKKDLMDRLREHREQLKKYGVSQIGLFGSFQRGQQTKESDVDLLVEFAPQKKTFKNFMALSFFLEEILKRPVELITKEALSPHIGPHILEETEHVSIRD